MILKQIGVCALGSFMMDPKSMGEALETRGANPPKNPAGLLRTPDVMRCPPEYLIHIEWDAPELPQLGFAKVLVNHRIRKVCDYAIMVHLIKVPYIIFFSPIMEEAGWRSMLT